MDKGSVIVIIKTEVQKHRISTVYGVVEFVPQKGNGRACFLPNFHSVLIHRIKEAIHQDFLWGI